jgi:acetyl-CoA carboxylase biotin carboxyl carrier protein
MKKIDFSVIEELNEVLNKHQLKRIRIKNGDTEIELESHSHAAPAVAAPQISSTPAQSSNQPSIDSPMIGTVYLAPNPDAKPFVEIGQSVEPGQVVCIIEAMKMFTKIKADRAGTISKICIQNQQPVDFGQTLFEIAPHV